MYIVEITLLFPPKSLFIYAEFFSKWRLNIFRDASLVQYS